MDKNDLRYYYHGGAIELIEFDPFTRKPINQPAKIKPCEICGCCCRFQHYTTVDGGIWGANEEDIKKHLAIIAQKAATDKVEKIFPALETSVVFFMLVFFAQTVVLITLLLYFPSLNNWLNAEAIELIQGVDRVSKQFNPIIGIIIGMTCMFGSVIFIPLLAFLLTYHLQNKKNGRILTKNNLIKAPSENWQDYLSELPVMDFPLPKEE
ncbi:MAG: hypothetical protein WCT16_03685 [Candidatus Buchananbacteria bacterium]